MLLVAIASAFLWYEVRPSLIRKECSEIATDNARGFGQYNEYDEYYKRCIYSHGL